MMFAGEQDRYLATVRRFPTASRPEAGGRPRLDCRTGRTGLIVAEPFSN